MCDEIFGRSNFVNMIAVNMKNVAGASGGGEDKRLKKNCEYILIYAKDYIRLTPFKGAYDYEEISELVERYKNEGISWKYTSVFLNEGEKKYIASTIDGDGNEIKIFEHKNYVFKSISSVAKENGITEKEVYYKFATKIVRTTMPQSSIRPRVMKKLEEIGYENDLISIEYVPKTGKNKGVVYTQFYKGDKYNLFAWLSDVMEEKDGLLYKKTLKGTYWDFVAGTKNLTKEGGVEFPNGKKPESLVERVITMSTDEGDTVLDSFAGSGTTAATAHKMGRKWITIELGEQAYTHCKIRLDRVVDGEQGGISKSVNWQGGGGYKFYELAPSLLVPNPKLPTIKQINPEYTFEMMCEAICKLEGFKYKPDGKFHGKSSEQRFIHITKEFVNGEYINSLLANLGEGQSLLVYGTKIQSGLRLPDNVVVKKIPKDLLDKCIFESEVK